MSRIASAGRLGTFLTSTLALALSWSALTKAHAAGDGSLERIKKAGKIIVALDATYPPMESEGKDGSIEGYDIDLAKEIAKRLGVKAEFLVGAWDGIVPGLFAKRSDVIIAAMNITEERQKQLNFVEYAKVSQLYVARKGIKVASEADLVGKIVAVQADTTSHEFIEKRLKAGVKIKELRAIPSADKVFEALKAGQADVVVADEPVARFFVKASPALFDIGASAMAAEPIGIGLRKSDIELRDAIQASIDAMNKDGFMTKLAESWFGSALGGG